MVNAFFCAAFGVSLEGLILVTYITVVAGGASDETIGLLARGKLPIFGGGSSARPTALIMALPVIFATYSSLLLLIGSVIMVINSAQPISTNQGDGARILSLVPVGIGLLCMLCVILVCEVGMYFEFKGRREQEKKMQEERRDRVLVTSALAGAAVVPWQWVMPQLSAPGGRAGVAREAVAMGVLPSSFVGVGVVRRRDTMRE